MDLDLAPGVITIFSRSLEVMWGATIVSHDFVSFRMHNLPIGPAPP